MADEKRGPAAWSPQTRQLAAQILLREEKKLGLVSEGWVRRMAAGEDMDAAESGQSGTTVPGHGGRAAAGTE